MADQAGTPRSSGEVLLGGAVLLGLYLTSLYSYLLFHSLAEFLAAVVGVSIFLLAWNARAFWDSGCLPFLGLAYLFISLLHLLHALAYKGMGVFPGGDADLPTQLWVGLRYLAALSFLAAPWFIRHRLNPRLAWAGYAALAALLLLAIFQWEVFPSCYVEGLGQTRFKVVSEYVVMALWLTALGHFYYRRRSLDPQVYLLISLALAFNLAAEAAFTLYTSVYGPANLAGHLLLVASVLLVYKALVQTGLRRPYSLLINNCQQSAKALGLSEETIRALLDAQLESAILTDTQGRVLAMNSTAAKRLGVTAAQAAGRHLNELLPPKLAQDRTARMEQVVSTGRPQRFEDQRGGRYYDITIYPVFQPEGQVDRLAIYAQDITERKQAEEKITSLAKFPGENPNPIMRLGADGGVLYANQPGARLLSRLGEQQQRSDWQPWALRETAARALSLGAMESTEVQAGDQVYALAFTPVAEAGYVNIYGLDITARRQAEDSLQASMEFAQAVLSSLSAHVAIVDDQGRILATNASWQEFARQGGLTGPPDCIGWNYLEVCDQAQGQGSEEAAQAAAGIRAVMAGRDEEFVLPYPCHHGQDRRWFNLTARRLAGPGADRVVISHENITYLKLIEEGLRESEERYRVLIERAGEAIFLVGVEGQEAGRILEANQMAETIYGYTRQELVGMKIRDLYVPEDATQVQSRVPQVLHGRWITGEVEHWRSDGTRVPLEYISGPLQIGGRTCILVFSRDISDRKRWEEQLRLTGKVFENTKEGVLITDSEGLVSMVNPAFTEITGYGAEEVLGRAPQILRTENLPAGLYESIWDALTRQGRWQGEIWNRRKDGEAYPEWATITHLKDERGKTANYIAMFHDISDIRQSDERIRHLALHDALTGLPNRELFRDRLTQAMAHADRVGESLAVMFLDLDRFKQINDSLGHDVGDQLLQQAAGRILECLRATDTVARLGGDEFTIVVPVENGEAGAAEVAQRVLSALNRPFILGEHELAISASIGISLYPADGVELETMVKNADLAMYRAKAQGRNNFQFFAGTTQAGPGAPGRA